MSGLSLQSKNVILLKQEVRKAEMRLGELEKAYQNAFCNVPENELAEVVEKTS